MKRLFLILFLSLFSFVQTAEDVVSQLEKSLRSTQNLEAKFEHLFYSAVVSTPLKEKGKLYFQKPDTMRWEYTDPEHNIYLYKGESYQYYFAEDNQLMRGLISDEGHESEILYLLTGQKSISDFYSIELSSFPTDNPQNAQIKLTPKQKDEGSYLLLELDKNKWLIHKIVFMDWEGNKTEFQFNKIKVNASLPKNIFELKLPSDVEIIERD
ncbi:MAG: outer membrane lipoprotein carrier protein LolA [Candidatus Aminicenantes bacterium]|nr:MAG: outer membrane lipoprotein carrier protein LolA [Candidatus Aminicenantes bacterium]